MALRPHLTVGLALSENANELVHLPSGRSPREAKVEVLEIGPLHNFLEKWWSEPSWVGKSLMILNQVASQVKMIVLGCQLITNQDP